MEDKKIIEEILEEAENSIISVNRFATKYKKSFYQFQKIFWELVRSGKLIKVDTPNGAMYTSEKYLRKLLGLS